MATESCFAENANGKNASEELEKIRAEVGAVSWKGTTESVRITVKEMLRLMKHYDAMGKALGRIALKSGNGKVALAALRKIGAMKKDGLNSNHRLYPILSNLGSEIGTSESEELD